jgi:hypothetical protein
MGWLKLTQHHKPGRQQMITEEEFERAQAIIHEYHRERQQQADLELEEDDPMNYEDEIEERRENERFERALNCECGAWVISQDKTKVLHVADCICGAE